MLKKHLISIWANPTNQMDIRNISNASKAHLSLSLIAIAGLIFWIFSNVLDNALPKKSVYSNAEIRFNNIAGVRTADYAIKKQDDSFLIASPPPKELELKIEFSDGGTYSCLLYTSPSPRDS